MADMTVGRARLDVRARGCFRCGTEHASGWRVAKTILVSVDAGGGRPRTFEVPIHVCSRCARRA